MAALKSLFCALLLVTTISAIFDALPTYDLVKDRACLQKLRLWFRCLRENGALEDKCTEHYCEIEPYPPGYTTTIRNMRGTGMEKPRKVPSLLHEFVPSKTHRFDVFELPVLDDDLATCTNLRYNLCNHYFNNRNHDLAAKQCFQFLETCNRERQGLEVKHTLVESEKLKKLDYPKKGDNLETCLKKREAICEYKFPTTNKAGVSEDRQRAACHIYVDKCRSKN